MKKKPTAQSILIEAKQAQNDYVILEQIYDLLSDSKIYDSEILNKLERFKEPVFSALSNKFNQSRKLYMSILQQ